MNLMNNLTTLASETASGEQAGLFQALGIDWRVLLLQGAAFLLLVFLLSKFVYPVLIRAIDKRQEQLDAGMKASAEAQKKAEETRAELEKQLQEARKTADEIVATAHKEAGDMITEAEKRAEAKAEHIVSEAHANFETEVAVAREALRKEATELVVAATEKVIGEKLDTKKDETLIARAVKESRQ